MRGQLPFARDFSHNCVQWMCPIKSLTNKRIMEDVFKEMSYGNESEASTAYLAAIDIVRYSSAQALITFLKNGGLTAFKNLIIAADLLNRGCKLLTYALRIFEALLSVNNDVRIYLLRYWLMLLRPVKKHFSQFQRLYGSNDLEHNLELCGSMSELNENYGNSCHTPLTAVKCQHRVCLDVDVTLFSEYLRKLEIIVASAPDSNATVLEEIFTANKRLDPFHKTIKDFKFGVPSTHTRLLFGPRLYALPRNSSDASPKIISYLKNFFTYPDDDTESQGIWEKVNITPQVTVTPRKGIQVNEINKTCFDRMKSIILEPPPHEGPKLSQRTYCEELENSDPLTEMRRVSQSVPSIVALANKNPLLFPPFRNLLDPTGNLENPARKLEDDKANSIHVKVENWRKNPRDKAITKASTKPSFRISRIHSAYGMELDRATEAYSLSTQSLKLSLATDQRVTSSLSETSLDHTDALSNESHSVMSETDVPSKIASNQSINSSPINTSVGVNDEQKRASVDTVEDLATIILRKALFEILEKPRRDIESEVVKLCEEFCERSGYCRRSVENLAEILVDKVLFYLTHPFIPPPTDGIFEDIKRPIPLYLHGEEQEEGEDGVRKWAVSKDYKTKRRTTKSSVNTLTLPVITIRKANKTSTSVKSTGETNVKSISEELDEERTSLEDAKIYLVKTKTLSHASPKSTDRYKNEEVGSVGYTPNIRKEKKDSYEYWSWEEREMNDPMLTLPPLVRTMSRSPSSSSSETSTNLRLRMRIRDSRIEFIEEDETVRIITKTPSASYQLLDSVLTKLAKQLSTHLQVLQTTLSGEETEADTLNKEALYLVQRVISNLALQMSTASATDGKSSMTEASECEARILNEKANSIVNRVLFHPLIMEHLRSSERSIKIRAMNIVNAVILGIVEELPRNVSNRNQNAFMEEDGEEEEEMGLDGRQAPLVWRPRGMSLAHAIRTGRLVV